MQKILTVLAAEGMVLAKNIETPEGRVLCGKGTILDSGLIDRLRKMDIIHICVEGHPIQIEGEKSLEEEIQRIEKRFSQVDKIPPLMHLKKKIIERLTASRSS